MKESLHNIAPQFFSRLVQRVAALIASWSASGFVHGVMNTDNMSLLGITIDLNVFGFLDVYKTGFVANYIDEDGRYAFKKQKSIAKWNLRQLGRVLFESPTEMEEIIKVRISYIACLHSA